MKDILAKRAQTNAAKSSSGPPSPKRPRFNPATMSMPDITVTVDTSVNAPALVLQLEQAVFKTINPISSQMKVLLRDLGFKPDDMSPFCQQIFKTSGLRWALHNACYVLMIQWNICPYLTVIVRFFTAMVVF